MIRFIKRFFSKKIIKDAFWSFQGNYLVYLISFIPSIIIRRVLGPGIYGRIALVDTIALYLGYPGSVIRSGMDRGVPTLRGQNKIEEAESLQCSTLTTSLILAIITSLIIFLVSFTINDSILRLGAQLWSLIYFTNSLNSYFKIYYRTNLNFKVTGKLGVRYSIAVAILNVVLVLLIGFPGLYIGTFIIGLLQAGHLFYTAKNRSSLKFGFSLDSIKYSLKIGFPILIIGLLGLNLQGMDRIFVANNFTYEQFGSYSLVPLVVNNFIYFYTSIIGIFSPRIYYEVASFSEDVIREKILTKSIITCYLGALIVGNVWFALPLILLLIPQFNSGILPARLILISCYCISVIYVYQLTLIAKKKTNGLIISYFISSLLIYSLLTYFVHIRKSLIDITLSVNIGYALLLILILSIIYNHLYSQTLTRIKFIFINLKPLLITILLILVIEWLRMSLSYLGVYFNLIGILIFSISYFLILSYNKEIKTISSKINS